MPDPQFIFIDSPASRCQINGAWNTENLAQLNEEYQRSKGTTTNIDSLDASSLLSLDTSGAMVLHKFVRDLEQTTNKVSIYNLKPEFQQLYQLVATRLKQQTQAIPPKKTSFIYKIGEKTVKHFIQAQLLMAFVGELTLFLLSRLLNPLKIRWQMVLGQIEETGINAIPIVGLLTFLLGIVIGYQGGVQLKDYGANIFVVELVTLTMLRELAPMMTAVIVAARSGSAFTAEIATMKVTEEVNAIRTLGLSTMDILVLPRMLGLLVTLPLLVVFADLMGILGGMVMAATMLDVSYFEFFQRIPEAVSLTSFMLGVGKAPIFAFIIVVVGCFQGLQVSGGAESVGRQTTISVVQAIFILIVADTIFSIIFSWLGI